MASEAGAQRSWLNWMVEAVHPTCCAAFSSPHSTTGHGACAQDIPERGMSPQSHGCTLAAPKPIATPRRGDKVFAPAASAPLDARS